MKRYRELNENDFELEKSKMVERIIEMFHSEGIAWRIGEIRQTLSDAMTEIDDMNEFAKSFIDLAQ